MKIKNIVLVALVISILALAIGCENKEYQKDEGEILQIPQIEKEISDTEIVSRISKDYSPDDAERNGDFVNIKGKYRNFENLAQFMEKIQNNESAVLQYTDYTVEGDPIIKRLVYNGKVVKYIYDNSRDKFAGSNKGISVLEGTNFVKESFTKITDGNTYEYETYYLISGSKSADKKEVFRILKK